MRKLLVISGVVFLVFIILAFRPILSNGNPKIVEGQIIRVYEGGIKDVVIQVKGSDKIFYINRGYEQFKIETLRKLTGKSAIVTYSNKGWTPFDPFNNSGKNIEKLQVDGVTFFTE